MLDGRQTLSFDGLLPVLPVFQSWCNRHQDFAVVGNAVANSIHWRDAKKLKDLGLEVIRNAHCPQDPAFMDACDELGLFVIVNTPGWQFWNNEPIFAKRVYNDNPRYRCR